MRNYIMKLFALVLLFSTVYAQEAELSFTVTSTSTSIISAAIFTGNGTVWCNALSPSSDIPSADILKTSTFKSIVDENISMSITITDLTPSTEYVVYCYAEETDDIPMINTISDLKKTISTKSSNELSLSFTLTGTYDSIISHVDVNKDAVVYCNASTESTVPTVEELKTSGHSGNYIANTPGLLTLSSLLSSTMYNVYCYAEDHEGNAMKESIESLKQTFTTEDTPKGSLTFSVTSHPDTISVLISFTVDGTTYCSALKNPSEVPTAATLKTSEFKQQVEASAEYTLNIHNLDASTSYDVYCYAEAADGTAMSETIESLKKTITTADSAPTLVTSAGSSTEHSVSVHVTLSSNGYVWCGVYKYGAAVPTSSSITLQSYIQVNKNEESTIELFGLYSANVYDIYCYAKNMNDVEMSSTIKDTKLELRTNDYTVHDCGFGVYNFVSNSCECSSGFSFDEDNKCTVEYNTMIFIIKIKGEADFSTTEKKTQYLTTVASDVSTSLSVSSERVLCSEGMPNPVVLACAILNNQSHPKEYTNVQAMQLLVEQMHTSGSDLYKGNITKDIDSSLDLPHAASYINLSELEYSPKYILKTLLKSDVLDNYQEKIQIKAINNNAFLDQIEYGYDQKWYNGVTFSMYMNKDETTESVISLNTNTMSNGVNVGYIRYMSDTISNGFYLPIAYYKTNSTSTCSILDGKTGLDLIIAYTQLPYFYPGVIVGAVIVIILFLLILCCVCCKRSNKSKMNKAGYMVEKKLPKPSVQNTNKNVKKSRV